VRAAGGENGHCDLPLSSDDPSLSSAMTVIVGVAARDGCVLVGDRLGIDWGNQTKQENVDKLYKVGRNVAIGLAGDGNATKQRLIEAGYIESDDVFDPRARTDSIANLLRKAFLGKTQPPQWWLESEERMQHLGKAWNKSPAMHTIIAGFDDGPMLSYINQDAAFVPCDGGPFWAIGVTHWSMPLLEHIYHGKPSDHGLGDAITAGVFCAYLTRKMSPFVGGGFNVMTVTARGVESLTAGRVADWVSTADKTFRGWIAAAS
jgi:20S proteasome alpha/beta subunit